MSTSEESVNTEETPEKQATTKATPNAALQIFVYGVILVLGLITIAIMAFPLFTGDFLDKMKDPAAARGMITFIFVLGTISIAILLTLAVLLRQTEEIERRYRLGRETLSILIGVVGTIIGYYFGTTATTDTEVRANTSAAVQQEISWQEPPRNAAEGSDSKAITE